MPLIFVLLSLFAEPLTSNRAAGAMLDHAIASRPVPLTPLAFRLEGGTQQLEQSRRPEGPFLVTHLEEKVFADAGSVVAHSTRSVWPYFTSQRTRRLDASSQGGHDVRARVSRRHPDLLLAAANRARASLRAAGASAFTFVDEEGALMRISLKGSRPVSVDWLSYDELLGDLVLRIDYGWEGDELQTFRQFENGRLVIDATYADLRRGEQALRELAQMPQEETASPMPPAKPVELVPLGPHVDLIRNAGGPDYHSLLVRFSDHLIVIEAPRSGSAAREAIAAVRQRYPSLPIRAVVLTHHHYDHIAGMREYAAAGARIVTTPGNVAYIEGLLGAPHTIQKTQPVDALVIAVETGHRWMDEANELVLIDAGPTEHVDEVLIAWLPREKIVFQGDLYRYDPDKTEPLRKSAEQLFVLIDHLDLDVRILAGVHGEPRVSDPK